MADDGGLTLPWLERRLAELLGAEMSHTDLANMLLEMSDADLESYAVVLLGDDAGAAFGRELIEQRKRSPPGASASGSEGGARGARPVTPPSAAAEDAKDAFYRLGAAATKPARDERPKGGAGGGGGAKKKKAAANEAAARDARRGAASNTLPGRRMCTCLATRHALLTNCLSCGNIVCEQQGDGECLSCGSDPDVCAPAAGRELGEGASEKAFAHRDKLLHFERTSAKRSVVIDDQVDYWDTTADAWLSASEREANAERRREAAERLEAAKRELTVSIDVGAGEVVQESLGYRRAGEELALTGAGPQASAAPRSAGGGGGGGNGCADGATGGAGPHASQLDAALAFIAPWRPPPVAGSLGGGGAASAAAASTPAAAGRGAAAGGSGGGGAGPSAAARPSLVNPWVREEDRPRFKSRGQPGAEGEPSASDGVRERAWAEGLRHSAAAASARVQHGNPWLAAILEVEQRGGGASGEPGLSGFEAEVARAQAERQAALAAELAAQEAAQEPPPCGGGGGAAARGAELAAADGPALGPAWADARACLSLHQPWASLVVSGAKAVEGRSWSSAHRGPLFIASTARVPTDLEIATVLDEYARLFERRRAAVAAARAAGVPAPWPAEPPPLPTAFPAGALLGAVELADVLNEAEYEARYPDERTREENGSAALFLLARPRALPVPLRQRGEHKIYQLDSRVAADARAALLSVAETLEWHRAGSGWSDVAGAAAVGASADGGADAVPRAASDGGGTGTGGADGGPGGSGGGGSGARLDLLEAHALAAAAPRARIALAPVRARAEGGARVLQDGVVLLRGAVDLAAQNAVVALCRELGVGEAGFYTPLVRDGARMRLQMFCLGKHWEPSTQRYQDSREAPGGPAVRPPPIPPELWAVVESAAAEASAACPSVPRVAPGICLVNHYAHAGRLAFHQDTSESAASIERGSPVVSLSIGDAADFAIADHHPDSAPPGAPKPRVVRLESGDVLVFGGPARLAWHAVQQIHRRQRPEGLRMVPGRLNLTFREL